MKPIGSVIKSRVAGRHTGGRQVMYVNTGQGHDSSDVVHLVSTRQFASATPRQEILQSQKTCCISNVMITKAARSSSEFWIHVSLKDVL